MNDEDAQREAENHQEQPRTVTHGLKNAIEDLIPGDSDWDGHRGPLPLSGRRD